MDGYLRNLLESAATGLRMGRTQGRYLLVSDPFRLISVPLMATIANVILTVHTPGDGCDGEDMPPNA